MNKNLTVSQNFFLSPFLQSQEDNSPYLSPFRNPFRKLSEGFEDLIDFRLEDPLQSVEKHQHFDDPLPSEAFKLQEKYCREHSDEIGQEFQEAASPNHSQHCEMPSTKFAEIKQESQPPFFLLRVEHEGESPAQAMIEFLIGHSQLKEDLLDLESLHFSGDNRCMQRAFKILATKFRKLKKTKEEMTKYCMRKAFKFIAEHARKDRPHSRDLDNCMRQYFEDANEGNFTIPFKKHSTEKTMNGNFLKRIFSCDQFAEDYKEFLNHFQLLVMEDNEKKVRYLATMVEEAVQKDDSEAVSKIKRLPWTKQILQQVFDLAISLSDSPQQVPTRQSRRLSE